MRHSGGGDPIVSPAELEIGLGLTSLLAYVREGHAGRYVLLVAMALAGLAQIGAGMLLESAWAGNFQDLMRYRPVL